MHPGDDPALASRFLGWLQARHATDAHLAGDVLRLTEMNAWGLTELQASSLPLDDGERARVLRLHRSWRQFAAEIPAEWAEIGGDHDEVTWVDAAKDALRPAPEGDAPRLVSSPVDPPARRPPPRFGAGGLLMLLAMLAVLGLMAFAEARARLQLADAIAPPPPGQQLHPPPPVTPRRQAALAREERRAGQALVAERTMSLDARRRDAVNKACEGGPWCEERLRALDRRLGTLRALRRRAGSSAYPARAPWPTAAVLEVRASLQAELAAGFAGLSDHEQADRRRVVEAELAVLDAEIASP